MIKSLLISVRALAILIVLTCVAYPLLVTLIGQTVFPAQANGSLVRAGDTVVGSALLAQKFTDPKYFWPRPSAADFGTVASGASNQGYTSKKLADAVAERRSVLGDSAPADLLTASASGLDPDISLAAARFQAPRVVAARGLPTEAVLKLIDDSVTTPQFGFLGEQRVNVLALNLALDQAK